MRFLPTVHSLTIIGLLAATAALGGAWYADLEARCVQTVLAAEGRRARALDLQITQRDRFIPYVQQRTQDVIDGRLSLREASMLALRFAEVHHPTFLEYLEAYVEGRSLHEKLARNMVCWLWTTEPWPAHAEANRAFVDRIDAELAHWAAAGP